MNNKKHLITMFLIGPLGYFLGTIIYELKWRNSDSMRFIFGLVTSIVLVAFYYIYLKLKNPKVLDDMKIEQDDEREKTIREKAGHITLLGMFAVLFLGTMFFFLMNKILLGIIIGSIYIVILCAYLILITYFKKTI